MSPKHPKATHFLKSKLFDGLSGFTELEARIRALPTEKERGDAFEVFAEAYFTTQKTAQAKEVWPFDHVPIGVKRRLALDTGRDMGVRVECPGTANRAVQAGMASSRRIWPNHPFQPGRQRIRSLTMRKGFSTA